ncbi:hypothetical protein AJ88_20975 [Mesorhizobium amorphae CCBAU 01583]|nr:hypothetical protein AJ88_20975 [Mesorhizobium amorphae CCBAU 01583]
MVIENAMNYAVMDEGSLPEKWWIDGKITPEGDPEERERQRERAERVKGVAIKEHNRWIMSRALDGWVPAAWAERTLRDSDRRVHNNMRPWSELDALTRRYDAVMLRALVGGGFQESGRTAWEKRALTVVLAVRSWGSTEARDDLPSFSVGTRLLAACPSPDWYGITELRIVIGGEPKKYDLGALIPSAERQLEAVLADEKITDHLCRIRLISFRPRNRVYYGSPMRSAPLPSGGVIHRGTTRPAGNWKSQATGIGRIDPCPQRGSWAIAMLPVSAALKGCSTFWKPCLPAG